MIAGSTRLAAVIGSPVRQSLSPMIHNAAYAATDLDWVYVALEVAPGSGADAVRGARALRLEGVNVTMPHKRDVVAACDELTPIAAQLESVNTVMMRDDGSVLGDSTDGEGFLRSLADEGLDPAGREVLVLGGGGAARAVAAALVGSGALVEVATRRPTASYAVAVAVPGAAPTRWPAPGPAAAEIVVNATPVGMGDDGSVPIEPAADQWIVDLVYHPLETPWLRQARAVGARPIGGLGMLVHQAALAFELWTGLPAPLDIMRAAAIGGSG